MHKIRFPLTALPQTPKPTLSGGREKREGRGRGRVMEGKMRRRERRGGTRLPPQKKNNIFWLRTVPGGQTCTRGAIGAIRGLVALTALGMD